MEARHPQAASSGAGASTTHPAWGPSFAGGLCALVAGPALGIAACAVAVWCAGAVAGWPTTFPSDRSVMFPQLSLGAAPLAMTVAVVALALDAYVRRAVFRRIARCDLSLGAAIVSVPVSPGLWLLAGVRAPLAWPFSVALGIAFLRWRSDVRGAAGLRPIRRAVWGAAALLLALGTSAAAAVLTDGPHLAMAAGDGLAVIGPGPSGNAGLSDWRAWPLDSIVGRRPTRIVYYRFHITTAGPLPLTLRSIAARAAGPGLRVVTTRVVAGGPTLRYGDDTTVRVTLAARRCPAAGPASVSTVDALTVAYSALDGLVKRTATFALPRPLRLTCAGG